jgi:hypothetical protein
MATLATQEIGLGGLAPAYAAAAGGGDAFTPDADTFLHVKNGSGGAITVTVATPGSLLGGALAVPDVAVSVPAGGERMIGPFPPSYFADSANSGLAAITYSGVTSLTIAVLRARLQAGS